MERLIRDEERNSVNFIDFTPQRFEEIKDQNQLIEEDVVKNIISGNRVEYPQDTDYMSFPNAATEIAAESKASKEIEGKATRTLNERDEEIA